MAGTDVLQVGTFTTNGRWSPLLDLNDGTQFALVRDTLSFNAADRNQKWAQSTARYEGARLAAESLGNATIAAEWYIGPDPNVRFPAADDSLASMELLFAQIESLQPGRYVKWQPTGATNATYFEIRGPAPWDFMYRWIEFAQTQKLHVKAGWTIAPLGEGERTEIVDDFSVDARGDYTFDSGSSTDFSIDTANKKLVASANLTAEKRARYTVRGYSYTDHQATLQAAAGTTVTSFKAGAVLQGVDAGNYIEVYVDDNGTNSRLRIDVIIAGVRTNRASVNLAARVTTGSEFIVRGRREGNTIYAEHYSDPTRSEPSGTPTTTTSYTLTTGEQTLGSGYGGWSFVPQSNNAYIKKLYVEPFVYRSTALPATISLKGTITGEAPAKGSLMVRGTSASVFGAVGFAQLNANADTTSALDPLGVITLATTGWVLTGASLTTDARYLGGKGATIAFVSGSGNGEADSPLIAPARLAPDSLAGETVDIEVWARMMIPSGATATVILSANAEHSGPVIYTNEFGKNGKSGLTAVGELRLYRLGTLTLPVDGSRWNLRVVINGTGSGTMALNYVTLMPARSRIASPTAIPGAFGFTNSNSLASIDYGLSLRWTTLGSSSGVYLGMGPYTFAPYSSLSGSLLDIPTGASLRLIGMTDVYSPDDTTAGASADDTLTDTTYIKLSYQPRYFLPRGA